MNDNDNIDDIRRDIEDTRQRISTEIDAIEGKLTPEHAKEVVRERIAETKDRVVEQITDKADRVAHTIADTTDRVVHGLSGAGGMMRGNVSRMGTDLLSNVRANPIPIALIGIGTGWLVWQSFRSRDEIEVEPLLFEDDDLEYRDYTSGPYAYGSMDQNTNVPAGFEEVKGGASAIASQARASARKLRGRAADVQHRASDAAHHLRDRAGNATNVARERSRALAMRSREGLMRAQDTTRSAYETNPIAFGALALAIGLGVGLALPHTRREDRLLGERRQRVVERARHLADRAKDVAIDSVKQGASAVKENARRELRGGRGEEQQNVTPEGTFAETRRGEPTF